MVPFAERVTLSNLLFIENMPAAVLGYVCPKNRVNKKEENSKMSCNEITETSNIKIPILHENHNNQPDDPVDGKRHHS